DPRVKKGEEELNELLKRQGKLTTESKEIRRLKKQLMGEIVDYADELEQGNNKADKKLTDNRRLINDCNDKLKAYHDELLDIPKRIDEVNYQLMLLTMEICYDQIRDNTIEVEAITQWITKIRIELKKNLVRKQEKEIHTTNLYTYMHQIFGAEVIELFDMKHIPDIRRPSLGSEQSEEPAKDQKSVAHHKGKRREVLGDHIKNWDIHATDSEDYDGSEVNL
ncbi:MAG: hypothetical protein LBV33_03070, partial [Lachnospiraceae bacterium]|nr:hypothetical protein [Lachnospiraceae bacterium]